MVQWSVFREAGSGVFLTAGGMLSDADRRPVDPLRIAILSL